MPSKEESAARYIPSELSVHGAGEEADEPLALYVHFPWCLKKCPYCDFLSVAAERPEIPHEAYADAVVRELHRSAPALQHRVLESVFIGGGTPSLWQTEALGRVLQSILVAFPRRQAGLEITVECNPSSFDETVAAGLLASGVNRVSIGVQGLSRERLQFLGRLHDAPGALEAVACAVRSGVPRVSADLIYGVSGQSAIEAADEVRRVADLGVTHVSAYALTIEPGTQFGALAKRGKLPLLADDEVADSFLSVHAALAERGFDHYEISNFARGGDVARHNLAYWRGHDYLGLGCGAWGTLPVAAAGAASSQSGPENDAPRTASHASRVRYRNTISPERYLAVDWSAADLCVGTAGSARLHVEALDAATRVQEMLMLGLRLRGGVNVEDIAQRAGAPVLTAERQSMVERHAMRGHLVQEGSTWRIPAEHWLLADGIIRDLL